MSPAIRSFIRHYAEMVAAMFAGMIVLGLPAEGLMQAFGSSSSELQADAPAIALLGMAVIMTVPMVAWMRHRGHGWRPANEMAASMILPTLAVIALLAGGIVTDFEALMSFEHAVMFPAMLVAMLLRVPEYTGGHAHNAVAAEVSA